MIERAVDSRSDPSMDEKQVYIQGEKKNGIFFVNDIQQSRSDGCLGKALPAIREGRDLPSW
jgi:preprotein translocase subunit SecB